MNLTIRRWIFTFGRWIVNVIDTASWWIFIIFILAVFSLIAAISSIIIAEHTWIILVLNLVFCFFLFILLKQGPEFQFINSRRKKAIIGANFISLVIVAAATFGCLNHLLARLNIFILPIMIVATFALSITIKKK